MHFGLLDGMMTPGAVDSEGILRQGMVQEFPETAGASIRFVEPTLDAYVSAVAELTDRGLTQVEIVGAPDETGAVADAIGSSMPGLRIRQASDVPGDAVGDARIRVFVGSDEDRLSARLMASIDDLSSSIVAPRTSRHWSCRPLFLISIPKAGTHLLYRLAAALGYRDGVICPDNPEPGVWYCLEGSNSHTSARDFLIERTKHSPFGNRAHPFFSAPALFIYRNPKDVLASEANWFHRHGNSPLAGYLGAFDENARAQRLLNDPWLLGSLRDRMGAFVPWLNFPNVAPLAFEDLVGAKGGGDDARQTALVWSLQLKLHVDGSPSEIAGRLYDRDSPTFSEGRIGTWRKRLPADVRSQLAKLPDDLFDAFGYENAESGATPEFPKRADEFRRRNLIVAPPAFFDTPILVESAFLDSNIVRFRNRYFGLSQSLGAIDLGTLDAAALAALPQSDSLVGLKVKMIVAMSDGSRKLESDAMAMDALKEEFAAERAALSARLNAAESRANAAQAELESLRAQNSKLSEDVGRLVAPLRQLEFRAQAAESRAAELSQQRAVLAEQLVVAERDNLSLVDIRDRLEREIVELSSVRSLLRRLLRF